MQYVILIISFLLICVATYAANATQGKVMIFTAPAWCADCKKLESTLADPSIQGALRRYKVVRVNADVPTESARTSMKAYNVVVVPTIIIFNTQGTEIKRVVGYQSPSALRGIL